MHQRFASAMVSIMYVRGLSTLLILIHNVYSFIVASYYSCMLGTLSSVDHSG